VPAGRSDDRGAAGDHELDGDRAHPTGRALHQQGLPGADRELVQDPASRTSLLPSESHS
jgi:hypothetical protein